MATWDSVELKFDPFEQIKDPLLSSLKVLEAVEAIIEGILDIVKAFLVDFGNPLQSIFALLLAAIRAIINQIKSTGFSFLLVHPDMSTGDFASSLASVSGSYPSFENKVVSKFYDSSDIFRPQYSSGSSVAVLALYLGVETPDDLFLQLEAILSLFRPPFLFPRLPAPIEVKVNPARKTGDPVANFRSLFDEDLNEALVVEWRMPTNPSNSYSPDWSNALSSLIYSYRFPSFVVERSETPQGDRIVVEVNTQTMGKNVQALAEKYGMPVPATTATVLESDNSPYRLASKRFDVTGAKLITGVIAGTYRFIDDDPTLERGKSYYYRVRPYFGDASKYVSAFIAAEKEAFIVYDQEQPRIRFGKSVTMGLPSATARGFVPRKPSGFYGINIYDAVYQSVQAAVLLNMELPAPSQGATPSELQQRTGWGTISAAAGQISVVKASLKNSKSVKSNLIFKTTCRRISNQSLTNIMSQPALLSILSGRWNKIKEWVEPLIDPDGDFEWEFPTVVGNSKFEIENNLIDYLAAESDYFTGQNIFFGPYPTFQLLVNGTDASISVEKRQDLQNFLRAALVSLSGSTSYLSWYSVTIGDLFPAFNPLMFDFEQFILALLKALDSALKSIQDIVETLLQKVRALETFLVSIINIIELLSIEAKASVLTFSASNASSDDLVEAIRASEDKPVDSPYGLHSGIVMTFGGPGEGSIAAFQALKFILGI